MTDFTHLFLSDDSSFVPSDEAVAAGKAILERVFPHYSVKFRKWPSPQFIISGDEFDRYTCPSCKKLVKRNYLDDAGVDWWYMVLWGLHDESQVIKVPCCGAELAVWQFDFGKDAAFASFTFSVEDADDSEKLSESQKRELEAVLGCRIRQIIEVAT